MLLQDTWELYRLHLVTLGRSPKTIKGYLQDLKQWQGWLEEEHNGPVYAKDLTDEDITDFLLYLKEGRDYKPSSRRRLAATIRGFLRWAYKQKNIAINLAEEVPNIKVPESERRFSKYSFPLGAGSHGRSDQDLLPTSFPTYQKVNRCNIPALELQLMIRVLRQNEQTH